ncbi:hypothetical protein G4177_15870 [Corallococcus sp. ZKHCc1 1396]|uniref:Lipoprotein n=1 Tax=Corallococcus soli TaxID=2710757 RepID=A0ABR9PNY6_9BACT|nr:hypothetical protein [Corallococcus soli]MBE4749641.1 hypothetical protein [Corallococcus soli]
MRRLFMMGAMLMAMAGCGVGEQGEDVALQTQESALACSPNGIDSFGQCRGQEGNRYCFGAAGIATACNYLPCESVDDCYAVCVNGTVQCGM